MTSYGRGEGGSAKSDFISEGTSDGGGVKKGQNSSDVIYGLCARSIKYL